MLTPEERTQRINRIAALPQALRTAVADLTDAQLDTPYREGGWTVRQVVHHLADSHINAYCRVRLALTETHPTIKPYDQDAWAVLSDAHTMPLEPSLAIVEGVHLRWAHLLKSLSPEAFARTAFHPENGAMSVDDFLNSYANHGDNHLKQITDLRARKGW